MIAFLPSLGWQEMFLLLVIGLLLYGRNLPEAGRNLGRIVAQLRRSFQDFKDQLDRDGEIRDVKKAIQDTAREVRNVTAVPRALANPVGAARDLAREAMLNPPEHVAPMPPPNPPAEVPPDAPAGAPEPTAADAATPSADADARTSTDQGHR